MNNYFVQPIYFILIIFVAIGCVQNPDFPDEPTIEYIGISKNQMVQNSLNTDSLFLQFSFTDGDGNIGNESNETVQNITITDNRTGNRYDSFKLPTIPVQGASKGIEGEITLRLYTTCCIFPENIPQCEAPADYPTDTLTLDIQIADRDNNLSNIITTESIILLCQ